MNTTLAIPISDSSRVGDARRRASALAAELGFDESAAGRVAIVATELATNVAIHARDGEVLVNAVRDRSGNALELLAVDRGPGMSDVEQCLRDGYSTQGTAGKGLGAVRRMSDAFEVESAPGVGTVVLSRLRAKTPTGAGTRIDVRAVCIPKAGETVSGDAWSIMERERRTLLMVTDGLGHGPVAADAAAAAVGAFRETHPHEKLQDVLGRTHESLRRTRGAAVAIAELDLEARQIHYCAVGNISARILDGERTTSLVSHNGTLGVEARRVQAFTAEWPPGAALVLHSDGLQSHWSLDRYPGLVRRDPLLLAGVLYRDANRGRDDVTVVVARERHE